LGKKKNKRNSRTKKRALRRGDSLIKNKRIQGRKKDYKRKTYQKKNIRTFTVEKF